jgi:hypothetical protein
MGRRPGAAGVPSILKVPAGNRRLATVRWGGGGVAVGAVTVPADAPLHDWLALVQRLVLAVWFPCIVMLAPRGAAPRDRDGPVAIGGGDVWTTLHRPFGCRRC